MHAAGGRFTEQVLLNSHSNPINAIPRNIYNVSIKTAVRDADIFLLKNPKKLNNYICIK